MMYSFAGTLASFVNDEWDLVELVVDFAALDAEDHSGAQSAKKFAESAAKRGALIKICPFHPHKCLLHLMRHLHACSYYG